MKISTKYIIYDIYVMCDVKYIICDIYENMSDIIYLKYVRYDRINNRVLLNLTYRMEIRFQLSQRVFETSPADKAEMYAMQIALKFS